MDVFDLVAKLTLDTSSYKSSLSDATSSSTSLGSSISSGLSTACKVGATAITAVATATTAVSGAMVKGVSNVAEYGDNIDKSSQKLGISAEAYQEWDAVLQHSGTSMDSMSSAFKTLANQAQSGSEAFQKLGISAEEASSMSTEELWSATIAGLQNMEEGTERTAVATDLLGKGATQLGALFNTSAEDTQAMIDTVNELGGVMSDDAVSASAKFEDSLQDLQTAFSGTKNTMLADFLPSITSVMDGLTSIMAGDGSGVDMITQGVEEFANTLNETIPKIVEIANRILPSIVDAIVSNLPMLMESALTLITTLANAIIENLPQLAECVMEIIVYLAQGLSENLPSMIPSIVEIMLEIVNVLVENLPLLIDCAIQIIVALAEGLINSLPTLISYVPKILTSLITALIENAPKLVKASIQLLKSLGTGLIDNVSQATKNIPKVVSSLVKAFTDKAEEWTNVGKNIVTGLWNGIKNTWSNLTSWVGELVTNLIGSVKDKLGVHSPSTVFAEIGRYMAEGLGNGWDNGITAVNRNISDSLAYTTSDISAGSYSVGGNTNAVLELLKEYLPQIGNQSIVLDTGALVGQTVGAYDTALGKRYSMQARYV